MDIIKNSKKDFTDQEIYWHLPIASARSPQKINFVVVVENGTEIPVVFKHKYKKIEVRSGGFGPFTWHEYKYVKYE